MLISSSFFPHFTGRTGTFICSWLLFCGRFSTAEVHLHCAKFHFILFFPFLSISPLPHRHHRKVSTTLACDAPTPTSAISSRACKRQVKCVIRMYWNTMLIRMYWNTMLIVINFFCLKFQARYVGYIEKIIKNYNREMPVIQNRTLVTIRIIALR